MGVHARDGVVERLQDDGDDLAGVQGLESVLREGMDTSQTQSREK